MTTTGNEIVRRTPQQELALRVRQDDFKEQIAAALPPAVTTERFLRVATTAILTNDDIAKCDVGTVMRALIRCATDGLVPDGKEAAIVKRRNKKLGIDEANYMPMISGYRKKLAEHGWTLYTAVVYANDEFGEPVIDGEKRIMHNPVRPGADRGELIASYWIVKHRDGRKMMGVLHPADIAKRRESSAYDAVWNQHQAAMWEKSAGRDGYDQVGLSEIDAERDRIANLIAANYSGDAARALYGPTDSPVDAKALTTGPPAPTEHAGEVPQADDAAQAPQTPSAAASPVPGQDADDEPDIGGSAVITAEDGTTEAAIELTGKNAALFEIPNGKHRGVTLGGLLDVEGGLGWLAWALQKIESPPEYVTALWSFARVFAADLYQEALAKKEAEGQS